MEAWQRGWPAKMEAVIWPYMDVHGEVQGLLLISLCVLFFSFFFLFLKGKMSIISLIYWHKKTHLPLHLKPVFTIIIPQNEWNTFINQFISIQLSSSYSLIL